MNARLFARRIGPSLVTLLGAVLLAAPPAAAQAREGSFERTLKVAGPVDLTVLAGSGRIRVVPGAAGTVHVAARIRSGYNWFSSGTVEERIKKIEQNPPVEQQGNTITIGRIADHDLTRDISISYDVTVPAETSVRARNGSGSIVIGALKGAIDASNGSGGIDVDGGANLDATTGSGSIRATAIAGRISARSGSGGITVTQTGPGEVSVSTGSGSVRIGGVNGAAHITTGSGGIEVQGQPAGPWSVSAGSGSVTISLPQAAAFDLDARSSSGSVSSDHPVTMVGTIARHRLAGKVRGGGQLVKVSTGSGGIQIR